MIIHYAVYDKRTTTGYKYLGTVETDTTGDIDARQQVARTVKRALGLEPHEYHVQVTIEIWYKSTPIR